MKLTIFYMDVKHTRAHIKGVKLEVQSDSISNPTAVVSQFSAIRTVVRNF